MKDLVYILMKNNSILKRRIKNPSTNFILTYEVDNEFKDFTYYYKREKAFLLPKLFGQTRISFYEHSKPQPLDPQFKANSIDMKEVSAIIHTSLFKEMIASSKLKNNVAVTLGMVLGLAGILGLVIIIVVSKLAGGT